MKARLLPLYFDPGRDGGFDAQLHALGELLANEAEFLPPRHLGAALPACDAVLFPQLLGETYRRLPDFKQLDRPILIVTSEFGTLSMWDWEPIAWLRSEGIGNIVAPYTLNQTRVACRALTVRRELRSTKFLVYQDNPGQGQQAPIFKRFYWWESECSQRMSARFGVTIEKRSFQELGLRARAIADTDAEAAAAQAGATIPTQGLSAKNLQSATKLYLAVKRDLASDPSIRAVGMNCLNESHFCDTTPCLAYNRIFEETGQLWGCEGDTVSMLSKHLFYRSLGAPILMTNLYPFLMGDAALKHERIAQFPKVNGDPRNYLLVAHCGYMGVIPQSFASTWTLRPKVLGIVDDNAHAIDARLPEGPVTLAKLHPSFERITVAEGELEGYAQYPGSDCLNGGIIRVNNGHRLMTTVSSHHYLLMTGHQRADLETVATIFGLGIDDI